MKRLPVLLFATLAIVLAAAPASAAVHIVNCAGGAGIFPNIPAAVAVAAAGDTIVVEPCPIPYGGFAVVGMGDLHIVAAGIPGAIPEGVGTGPMPTVVISEPLGDCVFIDASIDVSVFGLMLDGCAGDGMRLLNSQHLTIEGNFIVGPLGGAGISDTGSFNTRITGNWIDNAPTGIQLQNTVELLVNDNVVIASGGDGILVGGPGNHNKIFNNEVLGSAGFGIALVGGMGNRAEHNTALGSAAGFDIFCPFFGPVNAALIANAGGTGNFCGADFY